MDDTREIDARSIVTLIVFIIVNVLVIYPLPIPIPVPRALSSRFGSSRQASSESRWTVRTVHLGLEVAPVVGVLLLLASTCIPGSVIADGIVGSEGVKPYDIMTLFLCFAYISLSLDATGLLRYLAFLVGNKYSSSGSRLYFAFYAFFALTGMFIGNDPLILSGTPFLVYFTDHASIVHPQGYLFTHFQISNLVSALLVSSNPTNLVLTSAFKISFLKYSAWTALPTVAAAIILYPLLRFYTFNNPRLIPPRLSPPHVDASKALNDKWGGIFGSTVFGITIVLLVGLSAGGQLEHYSWTGVWIVVLPAAVAVFTWDCVGDLRDPGRRERAVQHEREIAEMPRPAQETLEMGKLDPSAVVSRSADQVFKPVDEVQRGVPQSEQSDFVSEKQTMQGDAPSESTQSQGLDRPDGSEGNPGVRDCIPKPGTAIMTEGLAPGEKTKSTAVPDSTTDTIDGADRPVEQSMVSAKAEPRPETAPFPTFSIFNIPPLNLFAKRFPTPTYTLRRMPWTLVPFAFSMFILVEGLQHTGWIRVFGKWWAAWVRADSTGVAGSVWLMGTLSVLGCNVFGTNIGATILLSRVLQYWQQTTNGVSNRTLYGAVYALAVGSNFGAYSFVFSASLAGLLWRTILAQKDRFVTQKEFLQYNWLPVIVTMIVGCLIVAGEVCVIYKD